MPESTILAKHDYWLEEDLRTVTQDQERAAYLIIREGQEVGSELLAQYPQIETTANVHRVEVNAPTYAERMAARRDALKRKGKPMIPTDGGTSL